MRVSRYEDLDAWKLATALRKELLSLTARPAVRRDFRFCDQIRSSAASITANIAEGFGRYDEETALLDRAIGAITRLAQQIDCRIKRQKMDRRRP